MKIFILSIKTDKKRIGTETFREKLYFLVYLKVLSRLIAKLINISTSSSYHHTEQINTSSSRIDVK